MALCSDAVMVLFYDIEGETSDHDDWHSFEHFHERLSVPGFRHAVRWVAKDEGHPRYLVTYEVSGVDIATSDAYLARLNDPTGWTQEIMPRFRQMTRGFCDVVASAGYGIGAHAVALRLTPAPGSEATLIRWFADDVLPALASWRGVVSAQLLRPAPPPPMTKEQALRGADRPMPWVVIASGYDDHALASAVDRQLSPQALEVHGVEADTLRGAYAVHACASAEEVARTPKPRPPGAEVRAKTGPRV